MSSFGGWATHSPLETIRSTLPELVWSVSGRGEENVGDIVINMLVISLPMVESMGFIFRPSSPSLTFRWRDPPLGKTVNSNASIINANIADTSPTAAPIFLLRDNFCQNEGSGWAVERESIWDMCA